MPDVNILTDNVYVSLDIKHPTDVLWLDMSPGGLEQWALTDLMPPLKTNSSISMIISSFLFQQEVGELATL